MAGMMQLDALLSSTTLTKMPRAPPAAATALIDFRQVGGGDHEHGAVEMAAARTRRARLDAAGVPVQHQLRVQIRRHNPHARAGLSSSSTLRAATAPPPTTTVSR